MGARPVSLFAPVEQSKLGPIHCLRRIVLPVAFGTQPPGRRAHAHRVMGGRSVIYPTFSPLTGGVL
jgi:hypothetical protein